MREFILQAKRGDRLAFDKLIKLCRPRITTYCVRLLKSRADGEQAAQEALLRAWQNIEKFQDDLPFENWLMKIATNTCLNLVRTKKSQEMRNTKSLDDLNTRALAKLSGEINVEEEVTTRVFAKQILQTIRDKAKTAKPPWDALDWDIFHLRYERGLKEHSEIARYLGKPVDTVKYRFYTRIQKVLERVGRELKQI